MYTVQWKTLVLSRLVTTDAQKENAPNIQAGHGTVDSIEKMFIGYRKRVPYELSKNPLLVFLFSV